MTEHARSSDADGSAALGICESLLLALTDLKVITERDARDLLTDVVTSHDEAATTSQSPDRHHAVVAIVYNASWLARTASAAEVVRTEMSPFLGRVTIEGPTVMLSAKVAQNFAPAVHELATNAAKYGALSNATGRVRIHWSVFKPNGHRLFVFRWQEQGGPPVTQPKQKGFGSAFLERVMAEYFETPPTIEFAATGVRYELSGSLDEMTTEKGIVERT